MTDNQYMSCLKKIKFNLIKNEKKFILIEINNKIGEPKQNSLDIWCFV